MRFEDERVKDIDFAKQNNILKRAIVRITDCLRESQKNIKSLTFGTPEYVRENGEILGYKTSIECIKRVQESLDKKEQESGVSLEGKK
jgi:hypothetical protein